MTMAKKGQKIKAIYSLEGYETTAEGTVSYVSEGYYVLVGGIKIPAVSNTGWTIEVFRDPFPQKPGTVIKSDEGDHFMRSEAGDFIDESGRWWSEDDVEDCEVVYVPE